MTIVVTGASGFIGSHIASSLNGKFGGQRLILVDNFSRGKKNYLDYLGVKTNCLHGDLRDYGTASVFTKNADIVFHTAGRIGGEQFLHGSPKAELTTLQDNLLIDANVFKACIENNVERIIYTSSVSVYNTSAQNSSNAIFSEKDLEKQPLEPEGGYGWGKYIGEKQLGLMSDSGIKTGIARIFKSYGPCDDFSEKSGQVVCSLMRKAIQYPKQPFVVWGDGSVTRNLFYIDDLIDGLLDLATYPKSLTVNLGSAEPVKISTLAKEIIKVSGKDIPIVYDKSKKSSPKTRIPDISLAKEKLGWYPKTSLEEGLQRTWDWLRNEVEK